MVERVLYFALKLSQFFIEQRVRLYDLSDLDELISLLIFYLTLPVLVELRQMQKLIMSVAYFRKCS